MTIRVNVLFFSVLRDLAGAGQLSFEFASPVDRPVLGDLLNALYADYPVLESWDSRLLLAVNAEFATRDTPLCEGDEVALMPQVQGG